MYIECKSGFFEVDRYQNTPLPEAFAPTGGHGVLPQENDIIVRARCKEDLLDLRHRYFPSSLPPSMHPVLLHTPDWDYAWRVYMSEELWAATMANIAKDLDYQNFKKWTSKHSRRQRALAYDIWNAGFAYGRSEE